MNCFRSEVKKLVRMLPKAYRYCQSMRITGEAKSSEGKAAEYNVSVSDVFGTLVL